MNPMRLLTFAALVFFLLPGCPEESHKPPVEPPAPPPMLNPEPPRATPSPTKPMVPMPSANREILVGGCLNDCEEPPRAIRGFLGAALKGDEAAVRRYLNTAALRHNGRALGDRWAGLFVARKLGERRNEIDNWLKEWLGFADRIVDPDDRKLIGDAIVVVEENQQRTIVRYHHPALAEDPDWPERPVWRIVLKPRGLEWLVSEIDDRPR